MTNAFDIPDKPLNIQRAYGKQPKTERVTDPRPQSTVGLKKRLARTNLKTTLGNWGYKEKI